MLKFCPGAGARSGKYEVNPGSKAAQRGVREGDVISSINGQPTKHVTNSTAHSLLRNAGHTLRLGLNEDSCGSPKRKGHKSSQSADQEQPFARGEARGSGRDAGGAVAAADGDPRGPGATGKGLQQGAAPGGSSRSRRRKRARANRLKSQEGEAPDTSTAATVSPAEEHRTSAAVEISPASYEDDPPAPEASNAGEAEAAAAAAGADRSVNVSSRSFSSESSVDRRTEVVSSSHFAEAGFSSQNSTGVSTGSVSTFGECVKNVASDNEQLTFDDSVGDVSRNSQQDDSVQTRRTTSSAEMENESESDETVTNVPVTGMIGKEDETVTNVPGTGMIGKEDETVTNVPGTGMIGKEDETVTNVPDTGMIGKKDETVMNVTGTGIIGKEKAEQEIKNRDVDEHSRQGILEKLSLDNSLEDLELHSINSANEYIIGSADGKLFVCQKELKNERKSSKNESKELTNDNHLGSHGLSQNDPADDHTMVTDVAETFSSQKDTEEEQMAGNKIEPQGHCGIGTDGEQQILREELQHKSSHHTFTDVTHIIGTADTKTDSCVNETVQDNIDCSKLKQTIPCNDKTEEEHIVINQPDTAQTNQNDDMVGLAMKNDKVRTADCIRNVLEESEDFDEGRPQNCFQETDYQSEGVDSFQKNGSLVDMADTHIASTALCQKAAKEKFVDCDETEEQTFGKFEDAESYSNNNVVRHAISTVVAETIPCQKDDKEEKPFCSETEGLGLFKNNAELTYMAHNKGDVKGEIHNDSVNEHIISQISTKTFLCENVTREENIVSSYCEQQGCFGNENYKEQITDDKSNVEPLQNRSASTNLVSLDVKNSVVCQIEVQEEGIVEKKYKRKECPESESGPENNFFAATVITEDLIGVKTVEDIVRKCDAEDQISCQNRSSLEHVPDENSVAKSLLASKAAENCNVGVDSEKQDSCQDQKIVVQSVGIKSECGNISCKETMQESENEAVLNNSMSLNEVKKEKRDVIESGLEITSGGKHSINENLDSGKNGNDMKVIGSIDNTEELLCDSKGMAEENLAVAARCERTKINASEKLDPLHLQRLNEWSSDGGKIFERASGCSDVNVCASEIFEGNQNFKQEICNLELSSSVSKPGELEHLIETQTFSDPKSDTEAHESKNDPHSKEFVFEEDISKVSNEHSFECDVVHPNIRHSNKDSCNVITDSVKFSEALENKLNNVEWETTVEVGKVSSTEAKSKPCFDLKISEVSLQEDISSAYLDTSEKNFQQQGDETLPHLPQNLNVDGGREPVSSKRYRTRQILEAFFMPNHHQRYLDVIAEEGGESNEEKESAEQNIDIGKDSDKAIVVMRSNGLSMEDSTLQFAKSRKSSETISLWRCSRHNPDECKLNPKHTIVWEKKSSTFAKNVLNPHHKSDCEVDTESTDDDDPMLARVRTQESEENAEVVFLEDTSSASSITIQGDDPGDDADIDEIEIEYEDYDVGENTRSPNTNPRPYFTYKREDNSAAKNKSIKQLAVFQETNDPSNIKYYDEPIYENVIVFRGNNDSKDFNGNSGTKSSKLGRDVIHISNATHVDQITPATAMSVAGENYLPTEKMDGNICCSKNNSETQGKSKAFGSTDESLDIQNEKIVDFFKHLFISLPEADERRQNIYEALMELISDLKSPLSPNTRSSLNALLSDESFKPLKESDTNKDCITLKPNTSKGSPVITKNSCKNTLSNVINKPNNIQQMSFETCISNPESTESLPRSLKDLALDKILSLPYGTEILICLGIKGYNIYSQNISAGNGQTQDAKSSAPLHTVSEGLPRRWSDEDIWDDDFRSQEVHSVVSDSASEDWVGMPTSMDPHFLVCMSPAQARGYRGHYMLPTPDEAQNLLDLHSKYLERQSYHDNRAPFRSPTRGRIRESTHSEWDDGEVALIVGPSRGEECATSRTVKIPTPEGEEGARGGGTESSSRLLAIIRASSPRVAPRRQKTPAGMETPRARATNRHSWAGQRQQDKRSSAFLDSLDRNLRASEDERLRAKLLSEWMNLARGRSSSITGTELRDQAETHDSQREGGHLEGQQQREHVLEGEDHKATARRRRHSLPEPELDDAAPQQPQLSRQVSAPCEPRRFDPGQYVISKRGDIAVIQSEARPGRTWPKPSAAGDGEIFRQQMYLEYMSKVEERKERRRQKMIRLSAPPLGAAAGADAFCPRLQSEFMDRLRERKDKLGLDLSDQEDRDGGASPRLPRHLHELLVSDDAASDAEGVWSPAQKDGRGEEAERQPTSGQQQQQQGEPAAPVWTPQSAGSSPVAERREFRPVRFQSPTLPRRGQMKQQQQQQQQGEAGADDPASPSTGHAPATRLVQSRSAPASGLSSLVSLPRAQNPTITLLQKAREGQLPKGALYLENTANNNEDKSTMNPNDILFEVKREYETDSEEGHKKVTELTPKKYEGIGPMTREGIPLVLRSEIRDANQAKWYKRMYDSLHRASKDDNYVTVRYRPSRGGLQYRHASPGGYASEPDRSGYHSDIGFSAKYATLDRRRIKNKENDFTTNTLPRSKYLPHPDSVKYYTEVYRNQPGRIEDYVPGRSSISDKETKQWWDEVLEIFDGEKQERHQVPVSLPENSFLNRAAKVSGYESDSTLVFKRRNENLQNQLSPAEQKTAYKTIQKGGEVPLHGLRKPAPERPKEISEIEYFPISPHLTRIRVHKQNITPLREIFCYPIMTHTSNNPPLVPPSRTPVQPVFSTFKRTAPSHTPAPKRPPPPPRVSSHHNSTLRLWSGVKLPAQGRSSRHEACFAHLTDSSRPLKSTSDRVSRRGTHEASAYRKPVKTLSASPVAARASPDSAFRSRSSPDHLASYRYGRSDATLGGQKVRHSPVRLSLSRSPELTSPSQVRKALQRQRDAKERPGPTTLPPGTIVKSSTALYSSARNSPQQLPSEQKSLQVTVAISAKGRELLKSTAKSLQKLSAVSSTNTVRDSSLKLQPAPSAISKTKSKVKAGALLPSSMRNANKKGGKVSTITENLQAPKAVKSLTKNVMMLVSDEGNRRIIKSDVLDFGKKQIGKTAVSVGKISPTGVARSSEKKSLSSASTPEKNGIKEDKRNDTKKKIKKKKSEVTEFSGRASPSKRLNGSTKISKVKNVQPGGSDKKHLRLESQVRAKGPVYRNKTTSDLNSQPTGETASQFGSFGDLSTTKFADDLAPTRTYSFFQNLFLRDMPSPTHSTSNSICRSSSVLEKARQFHSKITSSTTSKTDSHLSLLNVYLSQKRPVTESKFRELERKASMSSRSPSPRTSPPRRLIPYMMRSASPAAEDTRHFSSSLSSRSRTPDSVVSSTKKRSSSEPPVVTSSTKQTSRRVSSPEQQRVSPTSYSPSCRRIRGARGLAARPIESVFGITRKATARARSAGEVEMRQVAKHRLSPESASSHAKSTSSLNLSKIADHAEYQSYVLELLHSTRKSERFKELHKFYSSLERMGQLERATSSSDLRPRLKGEEIIDYDRWRQLRTIERAEGELKVIYKELKEAQREKGLLFRPKDAETLKWKGEIDRGLRCREKSVEDIKQQLKRLADEDSELESVRKRDLALRKDVYKPLWRGSSVLDLASTIDQPRKEHSGMMTLQSHTTDSRPVPSFTKHFQGIGSRLWSSLSMEQVNALKSQLSEIYTPDKNFQPDRESQCGQYDIEVLSKKAQKEKDALHVRCNSLLTRDQLYSPVVRRREALRTESMKADSISSLPFCKRKNCKFKDTTRPTADKKQTNASKPLSETEKKKLSHTLSKEVLDKVTRHSGKATVPAMKSKERQEAATSAATTMSVSPPEAASSPIHSEIVSPRTCYSLEMSEEDAFSDKHASSSCDRHSKNDFLLVLTPSGQQQKEVEKVVEGWANSKPKRRPKDENEGEVTAQLVRTTSASETESASSETSTRTVIHVGSKEEIRHKVNFFENQAGSRVVPQRVCRSASDVCETRQRALTSTGRAKSAPGAIPITTTTCVFQQKKSPTSDGLHYSQSYSDLKEMFGEQNRYKYATVAVRRCESPSPVRSSPLMDASTSRGSSPESLRHSSPDPSRYWRAYLRLAKHGDVQKLRRKFESLEDLCLRKKSLPRRYRSDPELARNLLIHGGGIVIKGHEVGDVSWLRRRYEGCGRGRSRVKKGRIVSPVPLKVEDRMMPHINVISKLAALQQRSSTVPCQRHTPEPTEPGQFHHGDVKRIKEIFERMSLLGQMFTSVPDVRELKDITPYLECDWVAHRYPDTKPPSAVRQHSPLPVPPPPKPPHPEQQQRRRPEQPQPGRDVFAGQPFDPSIHQPLFRYQPPPSPALANWWRRQATARPTVTFKEPVNGAVPGKSHIGDRAPESPHRYVESEVTIHYRSPVRAEAKQAVSEEELARRQAEAMRRIYQEERRRKYLQELQDMNSRRHTDNFTPSQKSPIPLNRYDDILDDVSKTKPRDQTPEPKLVARALYNFVGQTSRELSFRRGDIIFVKRQIDKNWYEGEHNAMVGLFPLNYVEIIPYDGIRTMPKRPSEGQARAKFNFTAQTYLELPLVKGELVVLTRRVDDNWYEGRIGPRKGIFPVSYVEVLQEPGMADRPAPRAVSSPASQAVMVNGSRGRPATYQPGSYYSQHRSLSGHYATLPRQGQAGKQQTSAVNQTLHIDTRSEPVPYRALYNYCPQNDDELELVEGDTVYVMEKCDDGWYVGSSQRTGYFGTFPGNYVERM